jgi:hypothetical protein
VTIHQNILLIGHLSAPGIVVNFFALALGFVENLLAYWNALAPGAVALVISVAGMYYGREETHEHGFSHKSAEAT